MALCMLVPTMSIAEEPSPAPQPSDTHVYEDEAMHMRVPDNFIALGRQTIPVRRLNVHMQPAAMWRTAPRTGNDWVITLQLEDFRGPTDQWESSFESEMREQVDGIFVRSKDRTTLRNGMPAYFMDMSFGEGFLSSKEYALVWSDGIRGVAITVVGRLGEIDARAVKKALTDVSATLYPRERLLEQP